MDILLKELKRTYTHVRSSSRSIVKGGKRRRGKSPALSSLIRATWASCPNSFPVSFFPADFSAGIFPNFRPLLRRYYSLRFPSSRLTSGFFFYYFLCPNPVEFLIQVLVSTFFAFGQLLCVCKKKSNILCLAQEGHESSLFFANWSTYRMNLITKTMT